MPCIQLTDAARIAENLQVFDFELNTDEMASLCLLDRAAPIIGNAERPEVVENARLW